MRVVIVDTNVASFLFKGDTRGELYKPHIEGDTLPAISFMTRAELEQWAVLRNWADPLQPRLHLESRNKFRWNESNNAGSNCYYSWDSGRSSA